jgi:hypothetical protein
MALTNFTLICKVPESNYWIGQYINPLKKSGHYMYHLL